MSDGLPYPDFVSEGDRLQLDQALERIVQALRTRDAQFLFGAGMSQGSKVPSCDDIAKSLLGDYFTAYGEPPEQRLEELVREYPFEAILEAVNVMPGPQTDLTNKLSTLLLKTEYQPNQGHRDFLSICWGEKGSSRVPIVFTTNFDRLLEEEFGVHRAVTITERNAKLIENTKQDGKIPVIHLHGVLDEEYQAKESDLFSNEYRILYYEFEVALHNSDAFVFVGYSMNDPDFRRIYMSYRDRIKRRKEGFGKENYVVAPAKDFYSFAVGKEIWGQRGAIWIPLTAEVFFAKVKRFMMRQYDYSVRGAVREKYHLADEQGLEDRIERAAQILRISRQDALQFLSEALPRGGGGK